MSDPQSRRIPGAASASSPAPVRWPTSARTCQHGALPARTGSRASTANLRTVHRASVTIAATRPAPPGRERRHRARRWWSSRPALRGTLDISRIATGNKCGLGCPKCTARSGSLVFDQERMNELTSTAAGRAQAAAASARFSRGPSIPTTPLLPRPGPRPGHQRSESHRAAQSHPRHPSGSAASPDFAEGLRVQQVMEGDGDCSQAAQLDRRRAGRSIMNAHIASTATASPQASPPSPARRRAGQSCAYRPRQCCACAPAKRSRSRTAPAKRRGC